MADLIHTGSVSLTITEKMLYNLILSISFVLSKREKRNYEAILGFTPYSACR